MSNSIPVEDFDKFNSTGWFKFPFFAVGPKFKNDVCTCGYKGRAWSVGTAEEKGRATGWCYCAECGKPSHYYALFLCDSCEEMFIPRPEVAPALSREFAVCPECS